MEKFVLAGKARTVFRLLELKAQREAGERLEKKAEKTEGKRGPDTTSGTCS